MKFAAWNHPRTGETRVYINGLGLVEKAFIVPSDGGYEVKCFGLYPSQLDELMSRVEDELAALNNGERPVSFSEVLAVINK